MQENCSNRNLPLEGTSIPNLPLEGDTLPNLPLEGGGTVGVNKNPSESKNRPIKTHPLLGLCRYNRKNRTKEEAKMWYALRGNKLGFSFRHQHQIGKYIVDFVCLSLKLVIECDGSQHNESVDSERTKFLEKEGYTVLRFWNNEILSNTEGCVMKIQEVLKNCCHPLQTSPLKGEDSAGVTSPLKGEDLGKSLQVEKAKERIS